MSDQDTAIIAGGCFWCTEAVFRDVIGVTKVESGYIGGTKANPTYKEVCTGTTGHAEGIRVTFDPAVISLPEIYDVFLGTHDPTQLNRQGNDIGTQYRSAIFPTTPEQREAAERTRDAFQGVLTAAGAGTITTEIVDAAQAGPFWYAEEEHQQYLDKNPGGYCNHGPNGCRLPTL